MRLWKLVVSVLLGMSLLLAGCSSKEATNVSNISENQDQPAKIYEMNLNIAAGPTHPFVTTIAEPWAEMVEKETNGVVKVNVFPSAALGNLTTALEDIKNGVYEAGMVSPGRHLETEVFPLTIGDLPFVIENPVIGANVLTKFAEKFMADVWDEGTLMAVTSLDPYQLYTKEPVRTAADLKGKKIGITGGAERAEWLKSIGAVPVSLNNSELYEGIQRGIIDGCLYTIIGANGFKLYEVAPYMTVLDQGVLTQFFMVSTEFLNQLPAEARETVIGLGPEFGRLVTLLYSENSLAAIEEFGRMVEGKGEVIRPSAEEMKVFRAPAKKVMDDWVAKANSKGYNGQEMMDFLAGMLTELGIVLPE